MNIKKEMIENRINKLLSRNRDNKNIIKKLYRKLRTIN